MPERLRTANLLLAAFLEAGGATIVGMDVTGDAKTVVEMDMAGFDQERVATALADAARAVADGPADWELWFERSYLDDMDHRYLKLKRSIMGRRR